MRHRRVELQLPPDDAWAVAMEAAASVGRFEESSQASRSLVMKARYGLNPVRLRVAVLAGSRAGTAIIAMAGRGRDVWVFKATAEDLRVAPKRTRPRRPQTNGKVERFNLTLEREWAWQRPYDSNDERTRSLPAFLHRYDHHLPHHALKGGTPMSRLNNLPGNHS